MRIGGSLCRRRSGPRRDEAADKMQARGRKRFGSRAQTKKQASDGLMTDWDLTHTGRRTLKDAKTQRTKEWIIWIQSRPWPVFSQKRKETTANTAKMSVQAQHADTVPPSSVTRRSVQRFRPRHHAKRAVSSGKTARFGLRYVPSQNAARLVWQCHEAVFLPFSAPFQAKTRGYIAKGKGRIAPPEGIRHSVSRCFPTHFSREDEAQEDSHFITTINYNENPTELSSAHHTGLR